MNASFEPKKQEQSRYSSRSESQSAISYPSRTIVHAKLEMTEPGDHDEQEADAVANTVVNGGKISRKIFNGGNSSSGIAVSPQMESQLSQLQGSGRQMPQGLRNMMESGFGRDFSQVRLHTDSEAVSLSSSIHAKAFTHGNDIYFNQGQFSPSTSEGQKLMAHELTHVVQGGGKVGRKNFFYNGMGDADQNYLTDELLRLSQLRNKYIEEGNVYALRAISGQYLSLYGQLQTDRFTTKNLNTIKRIFRHQKTGGDVHFVFAHGGPSSLRFNGREMGPKEIVDDFDSIIPSGNIKEGDTIVLMSCETGNKLAELLSKKFPKNLIIAPKSPMYAKVGNKVFTVDKNEDEVEPGFYCFLNGKQLDGFTFDSFYTGTGHKDNFSPIQRIGHTANLISNMMMETENINIEDTMSNWKSAPAPSPYDTPAILRPVSPPSRRELYGDRD